MKIHRIVLAAIAALAHARSLENAPFVAPTNETLNKAADRSGHTLAQLLLSWGLRRGYAVLPKSSTPSRIETNFQVPHISDEDFQAVQDVAKGRHARFVNMKDTFGYNVWPDEA